MEQDDEEFEQLLGEIPRATSAPPHLEELQRAYGSQLEDSPFVSVREDDVAVKPFTDIRCDEHYEEFYRAYSGAKKLPPPMDNRTIYNDLPILSPKSASNQLSPFYSGLTLDSPRTSLQQRQRQLELQHKVQQAQVQNHQGSHLQMAQNKQQSHSQGSSDLIMSNQTQQQLLRDEHSLSSAFGNLSFDDTSVVNHSRQMHDENGGVNGISDALVGSMSNGRITPVSNGLYSNHLDQYVSGSTNYGSGAALDPYVTRSQSAMDILSKNAAALGSLSNGSYSGLDDYSSGHSAQVIEKLLRRSSPTADGFSGGRSPSIDAYAIGSAQQQNQILLQQQQQQLDVYSAASMQPARIYPTSSGTANDMFSQQQLPFEYEVAFLQAQRQAFLQEAQRLQLQEQEKLRQRQMLQKQHLQHVLLQQQVHEQQSQARFLASLQSHANSGSSPVSFQRGQSPVRASRTSALQSSLHPSLILANHNSPFSQKQQRQQQLSNDAVWNHQHLPAASVAAALSQMEVSRSQVGSLCRYYAQGYCSRGDACPFVHSSASQVYGSVRVPQGMNGSMKDGRVTGNSLRDERVPVSVPEKIIARRNGSRNGQAVVSPTMLSGVRKKSDILANGHSNGHAYSNGHQSAASVHSSPYHSDSVSHTRVVMSPEHHLEFDVSHLSVAHHLQQQQQPKYTTLEEVEGRIYSIAKDQHGCRFLQRKFDEGGPEDVQKIFNEIIDHIIELMTDPFGNYLVQKLLEVCSETQRMEILHVVTGGSELVNISLNMHGTRAVQKLIETLKSPEQVSMVIASLQPGVVTLIKDLNGNHVVQRCLQRLSTDDSQFIFDAAATHCVEIATHRHGCCVLQRCVDFASGSQRQRLVSEIAANALVLSQDPFGNYVVQYILDLGTGWASVEVMVRLEGNYPYLATQKFSSNVVEKCLKLAGEDNRSRIVRELMNSSRLAQLLQDPYANYVMQSALSVSKGALHAGLVEAIRPHLPALRSSPYGKRILSRTNLKK